MMSTRSRNRRSMGVALLIASLALAATGCNDDKTDAAADTTVASVVADTAAADTAASEDAAEATDDTTAADSTAAAEAESPAGGVTFTDGTAGPEATIMVKDGQFTPSSLTVAVGDIVTFQADGKGAFGVIVGDLDGATVSGGLVETFTFSKPGTFAVREDISGNTATITVS